MTSMTKWQKVNLVSSKRPYRNNLDMTSLYDEIYDFFVKVYAFCQTLWYFCQTLRSFWQTLWLFCQNLWHFCQNIWPYGKIYVIFFLSKFMILLTNFMTTEQWKNLNRTLKSYVLNNFLNYFLRPYEISKTLNILFFI